MTIRSAFLAGLLAVATLLTAKGQSVSSLSQINPHNDTIGNILIPNVITPNGDGMNDCWEIPALDRFKRVEVSIYNDSSERLYHNESYQNDFCGEEIADGTYCYIATFFHYNEQKTTRRGFFFIKRKR